MRQEVRPNGNRHSRAFTAFVASDAPTDTVASHDVFPCRTVMARETGPPVLARVGSCCHRNLEDVLLIKAVSAAAWAAFIAASG